MRSSGVVKRRDNTTIRQTVGFRLITQKYNLSVNKLDTVSIWVNLGPSFPLSLLHSHTHIPIYLAMSCPSITYIYLSFYMSVIYLLTYHLSIYLSTHLCSHCHILQTKVTQHNEHRRGNCERQTLWKKNKMMQRQCFLQNKCSDPEHLFMWF